MENNLQLFSNPAFGQLRTLQLNGEPFFAGKDVADSLGYVDTFAALKQHVDDEDKIIINQTTLEKMASNQKTGKSPVLEFNSPRGLTFINESGLYALILSSKLPQAKDFKRWVTSEVLPAIRKFGVYATADFIKQAIANPDWAIDILSALKAEREKVNILNQQVAELQPKASYYDVVLNCKDLVSVSKIAKDYGFSAVKFNQLLHSLGVQFKQGDIWLLYQKYANLGWTSTKTLVYTNGDGDSQSKISTYWTQKGRLGLYDFLKRYGYLPKIETNQLNNETSQFNDDHVINANDPNFKFGRPNSY